MCLPTVNTHPETTGSASNATTPSDKLSEITILSESSILSTAEGQKRISKRIASRRANLHESREKRTKIDIQPSALLIMRFYPTPYYACQVGTVTRNISCEALEVRIKING
jgi:hypothetical protein